MWLSYKPIISEHNFVFVLINVALTWPPRSQKGDPAPIPWNLAGISRIANEILIPRLLSTGSLISRTDIANSPSRRHTARFSELARIIRAAARISRIQVMRSAMHRRGLTTFQEEAGSRGSPRLIGRSVHGAASLSRDRHVQLVLLRPSTEINDTSGNKYHGIIIKLTARERAGVWVTCVGHARHTERIGKRIVRLRKMRSDCISRQAKLRDLKKRGKKGELASVRLINAGDRDSCLSCFIVQ